MRTRHSLVLLLCLTLLPIAARAQALADRLPADALFYAGWAGSEKLAAAYAQSHLKGVMDHSSLPALLKDLLPAIGRRVSQEQNRDAQFFVNDVLPVLTTVGEQVWRRPTALYLGPLDYSGKQPMPKIAVLVDAGEGSKALVNTVTNLTAQIPADAPVRIRVRDAGGVVIVSTFDFPEHFGEPLAKREQFANVMKHNRPGPAVALFFDAEKVLAMAGIAITAAGDDRTTATWRQVLLTTGIAGVKRIGITAGFDGKDWGTQAFVESPQPRIGLLATLLEGEPIGDDLFKLAPKGAGWVAASRFDVGKLINDVRAAVARIEPNLGRNVDQAVADVNKFLGLDVQVDLLAPLGDQWLAYNSPQTGQGVLGMVLVKPLRDAAKAEKSLLALQEKLTAAIKQEAGQNGPSVDVVTATVDGLTVHSLAIPAAAPCWAVKNGNLYVALYPQVLVAAAAHEPTQPSVLADEDFAASRKRLGVEKTAASLSHMDLPKLAPRGYPLVLALQQTVTGFADMLGVQTPAMVLPPLNKITPHLAPAASATWVDDAGWHWRSVTPFPGAMLLGGEQAMAAVAAPVVAGVAIPAGAQARQQAAAVAGMSNLRQIGVAAMMYANDNKSQLPPDLGSLLPYAEQPAVFVSPGRRGNVPVPPATATAADKAAWVNQNSDYVYLGNGQEVTKLPVPAHEFVLAHEKFELARNGTVSAVYAAGHSETVQVEDLRRAIERQRGAKKE